MEFSEVFFNSLSQIGGYFSIWRLYGFTYFTQDKIYFLLSNILKSQSIILTSHRNCGARILHIFLIASCFYNFIIFFVLLMANVKKIMTNIFAKIDFFVVYFAPESQVIFHGATSIHSSINQLSKLHLFFRAVRSGVYPSCHEPLFSISPTL